MSKYVKNLITNIEVIVWKKHQEEKVNVRKYVNYVLTMIAIVLVAVILVKMYNTYRDNKLGESVFARMAASIHMTNIEIR